MTQMYGKHQDQKTLMLSSVNQTWMEWELVKMKLTNSPTPLTLKVLKFKLKLKPKPKSLKLKNLQKILMRQDSLKKILRWSCNTVNAQEQRL